jgi:hypothetical protein
MSLQRVHRFVPLWRLFGRTLLALSLGAVTTAAVATALANSRTWRNNSTAAAYKRLPYDGEAFRIQQTTSFVTMRQALQPGLRLILVNELSQANASADRSRVDFMSTDFDRLSMPLSTATLSTRFLPSKYKPANAMQAFTFGWPVPAMGVRRFNSFEGSFLTHHGCTDWLVVTSRPSGPVSVNFRGPGTSPDNTWGIPINIDASGFALDTVVYGGSWFVTLSLVAFARDRRARRRNMCKHCNYNRDGINPNALCPECGKPA